MLQTQNFQLVLRQGPSLTLSQQICCNFSITCLLFISRFLITKFKLNLDEAIIKTIDQVENNVFTSSNALNRTLATVVNECTTAVRVKSNDRIRRPYVDRDVILAIRERDRIFALRNLYPLNAWL